MYKNHNCMHKIRIMQDFRSTRITGTREKCNIHSPHVSGNPQLFLNGLLEFYWFRSKL